MPAITFDFDETLTQPIWNEIKQQFEQSSEPNLEAIAKLKQLYDKGNEIFIVTSRLNNKEIAEFIKKHRLAIVSIFCTAGKLKATQLKELKSTMHFDNDENEAIANHELGIATTIVSHHYDKDKSQQSCKFTTYQPKIK